MANGKRSTKGEVEIRVNEIYELIIAGTSRVNLLQFATKKGWDVSDAMIDKYIAKANAILEKTSEVVNKRELGKAITRLNKLYQSNLRIQDYKAALQVQKELNALIGLYAPTKSEHKIGDWRSDAIEYIRRGELEFAPLSERVGESLAHELFQTAGVAVVSDRTD